MSVIEAENMNNNTKVLYNGYCPVCSFEINHYESYSQKQKLPLEFQDLNHCDLAQWQLSQDQAAQRLYVLNDNQLVSGIPAFLVLWRQMPRYRLLAFVVGLPVIRQFASLIYDSILAPLLYRWHLRREAKEFKGK